MGGLTWEESGIRSHSHAHMNCSKHTFLYSSSAAAGSSWLSKLAFYTSLFSSSRPPVFYSSPSTVRISLRKFPFSSQSCRASRSSSLCPTSSRRVSAIQVQFIPFLPAAKPQVYKSSQITQFFCGISTSQMRASGMIDEESLTISVIT